MLAALIVACVGLLLFFSFRIIYASGSKEEPKSTAPTLKHRLVIRELIGCESQGRNIKILDTNGYYSYGILQYQSSTWNAWSKLSGIQGSPMNIRDSITMADWAIENGYLHHWSCAKILGLVQK